MNWNLILLIMSTLGFILFLTIHCRQSVLVAPFMTICLVVLSLYGFALSRHLPKGIYFVNFVGVVLGIYALTVYKNILIISRVKNLWIYSLFLIPFILIYLAIENDFMFLIWDELSFWARSQRLIYDTNSLVKSDSPISFKNYPPGQQLFQYYFTVMTEWSEKNILFAQNIFIFSGILAVVGTIVKKVIPALLMFITSLTLIYFFHADYVTIYSDSLVAIFFAVALALGIKQNESTHDNLALLIVLCAFVLIKEVAVIFIGIVIIVYIIKMYCIEKRESQQGTLRISAIGIMFLKLVIPILLVMITWQWYVSTLAIEPNGVPPLGIQNYMQDSLHPRLNKTFKKFMEVIQKKEYFESRSDYISLKISLIGLITWLIGLSVLVIIWSTRDKRWTNLFILLIIIFGAVAYHFFLLWMHLVYFTEYEGVRLLSFDRYSWTYMLAWLLLLLNWLAKVCTEKLSRSLIVYGMLMSFALYLVPLKFYKDFEKIQPEPVTLELKKKAIRLADQVKKHINPGERVYFIAQNTNGYEKHMFDFAMIPFQPNNCWSVGERYSEGDVWTCNLPLEQLINGFTYLAIYNADLRFWKDNEKLFKDIQNNEQMGVYKILTQSGKVVGLKAID